MGVHWLVALSASIGIGLLWLVSRRLQGSWIGPGGVLCIVWLFGTLLPLFFAQSFPVYASAYLLILLFVAVGVVFTSLPIMVFGSRRGARDRTGLLFQSEPERRLLNRIYWLSSSLGCLAPVALLKVTVEQFGARDLLELAAKVTVARYVGEFRQPLYVSVLTMFLFFAAAMGGLLSGLSEAKPIRSLRYLLWIAPLLLCALIQTTKASFLYGAVMFGGGLVAGVAARGGERKIVVQKLLFTLGGICVGGFGFILIGLAARYAASGGGEIADNIPTATVYCVGHMGALGHWTESGGPQRAACGEGSFTFGGLFELLGMQSRLAGLYDEMVTFRGGVTSNIYTAFRACIDDFTLPGALLFFSLFSFAGGLAWVGMLRGKRAAALPVTAFMAWIMWSPITSIFLYNSIIGALALFGAAIAATGWVTGRSRPGAPRTDG